MNDYVRDQLAKGSEMDALPDNQRLRQRLWLLSCSRKVNDRVRVVMSAMKPQTMNPDNFCLGEVNDPWATEWSFDGTKYYTQREPKADAGTKSNDNGKTNDNSRTAEIISHLGIQPPLILDVGHIISGDQVIREIKHQVKTILISSLVIVSTQLVFLLFAGCRCFKWTFHCMILVFLECCYEERYKILLIELFNSGRV